MSFLISRTALRSSRRSIPVLSATKTARPFHVSGVRAALSESDHDLDSDARRQAIDHHKEDQLNKQQEGKGEWKRELSSNSEAAVKADRGDISKGDIADLQKETSKRMEEDHEHGKK